MQQRTQPSPLSGRTARRLPQVLAALALAFALALPAVCPAAQRAVLFKGGLRIDIDGAPDAYHPDEDAMPALDRICHAAVAFPAEGEPFRGVTDCDAFMEVYRQARAAGWTDGTAGRVLWYGVASEPKSEGYVPCIQKSGPYTGYFVSATSLRDTKRATCDQEGYLNSRRVPYIVMQSGTARRLGLALGDYGVAWDTRTGNLAPVILGDYGRDDGEASLAAANQLSGNEPAHARRLRSRPHIFKLGTLRPAIAYLLFPGTSRGFVADPLVIHARAMAYFEAWGGEARLERELDTYASAKRRHLVLDGGGRPLLTASLNLPPAEPASHGPRPRHTLLTEADTLPDHPEAPAYLGVPALPRLQLALP